MNKLFDAQSWRNRLTALGVILDLKPLPEDVTLRVPADQINQVSGGAGAIKASVDSAGLGRVIKSGIDAHDAGQKRSVALNLADNRESTAKPPGGQSPFGSAEESQSPAGASASNLASLRCDDCAFREGTKANSQPSTVLKAQLCAEVIEPFYCHRREGLCAGWAELINKLHADGFHTSQPDWQKKLKTKLLEIVNASERGEITDGLAAIHAAVESCAGGFTGDGRGIKGEQNGTPLPVNRPSPATADKSVEYPAQQPPKYDGNLLPSLESAAKRAEERAKLFRETTGTFLPELVCQSPDCGKVSTCLFSCDFCEECNRRCGDCIDEHLAAGHESDSSTARERYQGIHLLAKGEQS